MPNDLFDARNCLRLGAAVLVALSLGACASRSQTPVAEGIDDDDAYCRAANLQVGSPDYVACRKDRDARRAAAIARADRGQRNLGEYMLNNPQRP